MLGFEPAYTTAEAFADFGASLGPRPAPPGRAPRADRVLGRHRPQPARRARPWVTPRSSRSAPAAAPAAAPASDSRRRRPATWPVPAPQGRRRRSRRPGRGRRPSRRRTHRRARPPPPRRPRRPRPRRRRPTPGRPPPHDRVAAPASRSADWLAALQHAAARGLRRRLGARSSPEFLAFLRRRVDRRLRRRRVRLRPRGHRAVPDGRAAPDRREVVPGRGPRHREHPDRGRRAGGLQPLRHHPGRRPDDDGRRSTTTTGRFLRPLGADLVFRLPFVSALARKGGATLACNEDAERMLRGGELVGVWPEGFKGIGKPFSERYKLQRFGRGGFVSRRAAHRRTDRAAVGGRRRGDLPAGRQRAVAGPAARRALHPDHAVLPAARPARPGAAAVEVDARVRRADPHRRATTTGAADDPMLVFNVTDQVRETIQQTLYTLLMKRRVGLPLSAAAQARRWSRQRAGQARRAASVTSPTAVEQRCRRRVVRRAS